MSYQICLELKLKFCERNKGGNSLNIHLIYNYHMHTTILIIPG